MIPDIPASCADRPVVGGQLCLVHQDHDVDEGWLCCRRAWGRLAGSLRRIPELCDELAGLGYVQRDRRQRPDDMGGRWADPVSYALPAGPLNGTRSAPRVSGSVGRSAPIRVDPTDLLARPRHGSLSVAERSPWQLDQIGHLPVATTLDFWVRDWADLRGETLPELGGEHPPARRLAGWLLDRLDWACQHHFALGEFAEQIQQLSSALYGLAGHAAARPKAMEAPCPGCGWMTLIQPIPDTNIECSGTECARILTPVEYAQHVTTLIEENTP